MLNLLARIAGVALFVAGCLCVRAIPDVIGYAYHHGPLAGTGHGIAVFAGCAAVVVVLVLVSVPLILAGLFALLFRLKPLATERDA